MRSRMNGVARCLIWFGIAVVEPVAHRRSDVSVRLDATPEVLHAGLEGMRARDVGDRARRLQHVRDVLVVAVEIGSGLWSPFPR